MNPLFAQFITGLIRAVLTGVGGALVARGWFTGEEISQYVTEFSIGAGVFIAGVVWSFVNKYWSRWKLLLAIESPPTTEATIETKFDHGIKPMTAITQKADGGIPPMVTALLASVVGASLLGAPACAGKNAPVLVGQTGLAIADGIEQMQIATKQLTEAGVVPPRTALTIQETLLRANDRLKPLPPLLRAIDAAQQANDPTAALVDQALALVQAVSADLDLVIGGVPISDAAKQLLALAQATRQTVTTLIANLERLRAQE